MKLQEKPKLNLKELEKLHPTERQKILKDLLTREENKDFLKLINEEIKKAELEEETLEKSGDVPKKEDKEKNLDSLVQKLADKEDVKEQQKNVFGDVYGIHKDETYKMYSNYNSHKHEDFNQKTSSGLNSDKVTIGIGEENLSNSFGFKKITDLYKKDKKEGHEHGH